jgi:hypothetical protein
MMVFDLKTGEILGSTYSKEHAKKVIEIEQMAENLENKDLSEIDSGRKSTWAMLSFERKIVVFSRVKGDISLSAEYALQKSPTGAIEDILEIALLVNNLI